jgi:hypothetical protein
MESCFVFWTFIKLYSVFFNLSKNTAYLNDIEVNTVFVNARDLRTSATRHSNGRISSKSLILKTVFYEEFLV